MSSLQSALPADYPITGLCIVADKSRCPPGYQVLDRTVEGQDADIWRDGFFGKKTLRYCCITRIFPLDQGRVNNVLADMAILSKENPPPVGWSTLATTLDSKEPVLKKHQLAVRMLPRSYTQAAVCDLLLLAKAKRAPAGYTLIGELNGMLICLKIGPIPQQQQQQQQSSPPSLISMPPSYMSTPPSYSMGPIQQNQSSPSHLPYSRPAIPARPAPVAPPQTSPTRTGVQVQRSQELPRQQANPSFGIEGVPFQLNKKFDTVHALSNVNVPEISYKSEVEINNHFQYEFNIERSAVQRISP
uniref:Multivesicular body subunit 12B-like n=1 Tax=Saccoglossus kowalevskii TaxID=10224 RepID=A0ABM0MAU7_SACKO|nr:PREDICTED: multivesicular body subunit 12B-like [Saccoglossus kowalevskii]